MNTYSREVHLNENIKADLDKSSNGIYTIRLYTVDDDKEVVISEAYLCFTIIYEEIIIATIESNRNKDLQDMLLKGLFEFILEIERTENTHLKKAIGIFIDVKSKEQTEMAKSYKSFAGYKINDKRVVSFKKSDRFMEYEYCF